MASDHVLSIPRSDSGGENVLVNVVPNGKAALDVKLVATEGESPYITTIKQSSVSKYQAKNSAVSSTKWETILRSVLLQQRADAGASEATQFLEVVASVSGDKLIVLFRKSISGIHQRLGEISLSQDNDQEIDTIAWVSTAVGRANALEKDVINLQAKYEEQGETMKKLENQLEDLIKAKKEHEKALLEQFRELLNMKKLKIRDQQRLLATAKVNVDTAKHVRAARSPSASAAPASSRPSKRKQNCEVISSPSDSEDSGFEKMAVGEPGLATPDKSDLDATEDEDEDLDATSHPRPTMSGVGNKGRVIETAKADTKPDEPPPRRELPFAKIGGKGKEKAEPLAEEEDEVEEEAAGTNGGKTENAEAEMEEDDDETSDDEL
ncbi:hypothetical protein MMC30_001507 [Trapelia coarctata]|nr:hypothetical protein [Trapelia coarctata]